MLNIKSFTSQATFPFRLYELIETEPKETIGWSAHGQSFVIHDIVWFTQEILPKYFRHTKFTSFQRQLNLYGFRRITKGPDTGAYYHPNFQRGCPELIRDVKRVPGKGSSSGPTPICFQPEVIVHKAKPAISSRLSDVQFVTELPTVNKNAANKPVLTIPMLRPVDSRGHCMVTRAQALCSDGTVWQSSSPVWLSCGTEGRWHIDIPMLMLPASLFCDKSESGSPLPTSPCGPHLSLPSTGLWVDPFKDESPSSQGYQSDDVSLDHVETYCDISAEVPQRRERLESSITMDDFDFSDADFDKL